jgi:hypothetical protein
MKSLKEIIKVWITKYALTKGIFSVDVEVIGEETQMVLTVGEAYSRSFHHEGDDWHRTSEGAVAKAEEMRLKKIASLKKQIAKLEKLSF